MDIEAHRVPSLLTILTAAQFLLNRCHQLQFTLVTPSTYWFILHSGAGDTPIEFVVIHNTGINQCMYRHLILEDQEAVACKHKWYKVSKTSTNTCAIAVAAAVQLLYVLTIPMLQAHTTKLIRTCCLLVYVRITVQLTNESC